MKLRPGLSSARLAVDGTSYDPVMTGAARRTHCLLPRLASRGWQPILFVNRGAETLFKDLPGVEIVILDVPAHPGPLRSALARPAMAAHGRRLGATVFMTETPPAPVDLPFALMIHDLRAWDRPESLSLGRKWWTKRVIPKAAAKAAAILAPSEFTAAAVRRRFPHSRVVLSPNGCDHFPVAMESPAREDFLLAVGPWSRRKNLRWLLQAWSGLPGPPPLVLVGRVSDQLPPGVEVRSASDTELGELYRRAAATLCPSTYEGFGLPLAEAMAQGCPVLASDLPPHREVGGEAARYFQAGSEQDFRRQWQAMQSHPPSANELLAQASRFPWRRCAEIVDGVLREIRVS
ncbi:MAG: glycosyltransferase family 1 protein [Planctomycetota bacterium]|nr:MAG: glycosyltransferase family 1 protein [Planctomycetota bacterium]